MKPWGWWLLTVILIAITAAWMFRYEPMWSHARGETELWDRWLHQPVRHYDDRR